MDLGLEFLRVGLHALGFGFLWGALGPSVRVLMGRGLGSRVSIPTGRPPHPRVKVTKNMALRPRLRVPMGQDPHPSVRVHIDRAPPHG